MRILIDECLPAQLKDMLVGHHEAETVSDRGWSGLRNGDLLSHASRDYDAFLTADQGIPFQQNLSGFHLAVVIVPTNRLKHLRYAVPLLIRSLENLHKREIAVMDLPGEPESWPKLQLNRIEREGRTARHLFGV